MKQELSTLYKRDLEKLENEINLFKEEGNIWKTIHQVPNSAGNLSLHLVGNLQTYIGKNLGSTGYIRNREMEFLKKNVPREDLINKIKDTRLMIGEVLYKMTENDMKNIYPENALGYEMTVNYFLMHLLAHLSYH